MIYKSETSVTRQNAIRNVIWRWYANGIHGVTLREQELHLFLEKFIKMMLSVAKMQSAMITWRRNASGIHGVTLRE